MVSPRRIKADLTAFARGYTRSRVGLFFSLAFPIILILLFGAIFSGSGNSAVPVYVQNQDGSSPGSMAFIQALNSTGSLQLTLVDSSQNFTQYLLAHSISDGIVIPAGFQAGYLSRTPVTVTIYGDPASTTSQAVFGITEGVINGFNLRAVNGSATLEAQQLTVNAQSYKYIDFLIPGMIGFAILISPMFALVNVSSQYKRDKIFKQLSLTPLTKTEWLIAKILFYFILTIISFFLMTGFGIFAFGAHIGFSIWILPFLLLGPFLFVSLGMLVGTVSNSVESAAVVGNLITFPMMFLSGTFFPVSTMPAYLQNVAHVLPLFYVIDGLNNVMIYGNISAALVDIAVLIVASLVVFALAVRFFKWRED
ncbi:MAG: ABC transporter permease [Thaumarchaeota archaeon]|nr:ABC transporter permease [Nitrososphaerota archaeon]